MERPQNPFISMESVVSVLFFSTVHDSVAQGFKAISQAEAWPDQLEILRSIKALRERLHRPRGNLVVAVVNIASPEELTEVVSLKELLEDLATIVILPNVSAENVARAHEIRPRFLTGTDSSPIVIGAVLAKMLRNRKTNGCRREG